MTQMTNQVVIYESDEFTMTDDWKDRIELRHFAGEYTLILSKYGELLEGDGRGWQPQHTIKNIKSVEELLLAFDNAESWLGVQLEMEEAIAAIAHISIALSEALDRLWNEES